MSHALIEVEGLRKTFVDGVADVSVLDGLSLSINKGERVALLGQSGSGKSTLLRILGALDTQFDGRVSVAKCDVAAFTQRGAADFRNREIGFVFQSYKLLAQLSALDNVCLPAIFSGEKSDTGRGNELLRLMGLKGKEHRRPSHLSGGEQQRVAIARALYNKPKLLLLDEPTGNLDQRTGEHILSLFDELHDGGTTFVMATHDAAIAERSERVLTLTQGVFK